MSKKKKLILILVVCIFSVPIIVCACYTYNFLYRDDIGEWSKEVEKFYNDNKQTFEEFKTLCFDYDIEYIGVAENPNHTDDILNMIQGYYIYSSNTLDETQIREMQDVLQIISKCRLSSVYVRNNEYVSMGLGRMFSIVGLTYTEEIRSLDEIIKESFLENAWYIDDHWYIEIFGG